MALLKVSNMPAIIVNTTGAILYALLIAAIWQNWDLCSYHLLSFDKWRRALILAASVVFMGLCAYSIFRPLLSGG